MDRRRFSQILGLGIFLVSYGTNVSTPFLVSYRSRLELGDSATMAIFTVYVVGILLVLPVAGQLSDKHGRRQIAIPFVIISAIASLVMIFGQDSVIFLLLGRFLLGLVSGAVLSIGSAWMQEILGEGNEQRSAVLSTLLTFGGFGLGPPISAGIHYLDAAPLTTPYVLHAAATLLVVPFMLGLPDERARSNEPLRLKLGVPNHGRELFWRRIAPAAVWVFSFPSTSFALFPVIISDAVDGSPVIVAAVSGTLTAWSALVARPLLPLVGPDKALEIGMAGGTCGYACGAAAFITGTWWFVLPAAFLLGASSGMMTGGSLALLNRIADDETRGSINATFYLLAYPGMAMPIILTLTSQVIGLTTALVGATALAATAALFVRLRSGPNPAIPT